MEVLKMNSVVMMIIIVTLVGACLIGFLSLLLASGLNID